MSIVVVLRKSMSFVLLCVRVCNPFRDLFCVVVTVHGCGPADEWMAL